MQPYSTMGRAACLYELLACVWRHISRCTTSRHCLMFLVTSRLDLGNAVLFGFNRRLLQKLQWMQLRVPNHACVNCTILAARSMPYKVHTIGVDVPIDARSRARIHR